MFPVIRGAGAEAGGGGHLIPSPSRGGRGPLRLLRTLHGPSVAPALLRAETKVPIKTGDPVRRAPAASRSFLHPPRLPRRPPGCFLSPRHTPTPVSPLQLIRPHGQLSQVTHLPSQHALALCHPVSLFLFSSRLHFICLLVYLFIWPMVCLL